VSGDDTAQIRFDLTSDSYTQLGGWNIDDVCLMAWQPAPLPEVPKSESPDEDVPVLGPVLAPGGGCGCRTSPATGGASSLGIAITAVLIALRRRRDQRIRAARST
jgi:MYXO-CTERM domain-containing protein